MQESMFSALFGAITNEIRMNNIANNLANVNTTGYKRDQVSFQDTFLSFAHDVVMEPMANVRSKKLFPEPMHAARPRIALAQTDFSQGSLKYTGDPLDIALAGEGFFRIRTQDGDYLTRNGKLNLNGDGVLVTAQGHPILTEDGGTITVPDGTRNILIIEDGNVYADGAGLGQIAVQTVEDDSLLEKLGNNMYRARQGANIVEMPVDAPAVQQGYLEAANVEVVTEMVNMIETQRQFEAYQKVMQTSDNMDREAYSRVGKGNA